MTPPPTANHSYGRLTSDDALFVVMERVLGVPVTNQFIWRLPAPQNPDKQPPGQVVDDDSVAELGAALRRGRLGRLVRRSHGPTRDRWVREPSAGLIRTGLPTVATGAESQWIRDQLRLRLDSVTGPAWALTTAPTADGGRLVSLAFSHVIADGQGAITAVLEALRGQETHAALPAGTDTTVGHSLRDAASLLGDAASSAWGLLRTNLRSARSPHRSTTGTPPNSGTHDAAHVSDGTATTGGAQGRLPTIAVEVDGPRFAARAAAAGGTSNTLFAAVTLGVLVATGRVGEGDTVPISLPMSLRGDDDLRANATSGATAHVVVSSDRYTDLTPIRAASKAGLQRVSAGEFNSVDAMARIAQALPDPVVRRLAGTASTPLCLASNLGTVDTLFASLGGSVQGRVASRSVTIPDDGGSQVRAGGISAWVTLADTRLSLCFTALDASLIPDEEHLANLVTTELHQWDIPTERWL